MYRFFYHFRRSTGGMTVHFKGTCMSCENVKCMVPCETKRRNEQPKLVMQGFCKEVILDKGLAIIK